VRKKNKEHDKRKGRREGRRRKIQKEKREKISMIGRMKGRKHKE
jgi:hypothetical protein